MSIKGTTICAVRRNGECAIAGDGKELEIGFNVRYFMESIRAIPSEEVMLELTNNQGDVLTVEDGFAEHANLYRRDNAYPQSGEHFTVYLTGYTPVEKTFRIGTRGFAQQDLLPRD